MLSMIFTIVSWTTKSVLYIYFWIIRASLSPGFIWNVAGCHLWLSLFLLMLNLHVYLLYYHKMWLLLWQYFQISWLIMLHFILFKFWYTFQCQNLAWAGAAWCKISTDVSPFLFFFFFFSDFWPTFTCSLNRMRKCCYSSARQWSFYPAHLLSWSTVCIVNPDALFLMFARKSWSCVAGVDWKKNRWLTHAAVRVWGRRQTPASGLVRQSGKSRDGVCVCLCVEEEEGWRLWCVTEIRSWSSQTTLLFYLRLLLLLLLPFLRSVFWGTARGSL